MKRSVEALGLGPDGHLQNRPRISRASSPENTPGEPATSNSTAEHENIAVTSRPRELSRSGVQDSYPAQSRRQGVHLCQVNPEKIETETDVDIIAIHGLDTRSPDTWTWIHSDSKLPRVNWLQDPSMLPKVAGRARIFTCDWPADLLQKLSSIPTTIKELAKLLLAGIHNMRRDLGTNGPETDDRPILFIASCLGGIILIEALLVADQDKSNYNHLRRATRGILFLATPFRGTAFENAAKWAVPMLKTWASLQDQAVTTLLGSVQGSTPDLRERVRRFTALCLINEHPCQVSTFYEKGKTNLQHKIIPTPFRPFLPEGKELVDENSGTLDIDLEPLPLDRPHVIMNKFHGAECPDYRLVAGKVRDILGKIRRGAPLERADAWLRDKCYSAENLKIERLSGDMLSMNQCYINLAIVEQSTRNEALFEEGDKTLSEDGAAARRSSQFTLRARLKVEEPNKDIQVSLSELFGPRKGDNSDTKQRRRILIRGRAGVGKTTLFKKIIYEFTHSPIKDEFRKWQELFDRMLWVPLRNLKLEERRQNAGYNFKDLFIHEYFPQADGGDLARALWHTLQTTESSRTLFLLDGLDEVYQDLDSASSMFRFLRELLNQPNVIVTSRPHASLPELDRFDLHVETIGFYREQVKHYIENVLSKSPGKADQVQIFLEDHPLVQDLVRIPILLDALCHIYDYAFPKAKPETMTALYQTVEHWLWKKDAVRLEKRRQGNQVTDLSIRSYRQRELEGLVQDEIHFLEGLAFNGLHSDVIDFDSTQHLDTIFSHFPLPKTTASLDETLARLSFLRTHSPLSDYRNRSYHFLHLTFQEYFAARYFVRQWMSNQDLICVELKTGKIGTIDTVLYLQKYKYNARYNILWRIIAGLLQINANEDQLCRFFRTIEMKPRDLFGTMHQRLVMHCLSEVVPSEDMSEFHRLRGELEGQLSQWLLFECQLIGYTKLGSEIECPDHLLIGLLHRESHAMIALNELRTRPRVSSVILGHAASQLENDCSKDLKDTYLRILLHHHKSMPNSMVPAIISILKYDSLHMRQTAVKALKWEPSLSETVLQALASLLEDDDPAVRRAAAESLGSQSSLSETVLQALASLLEDDNPAVRQAAALSLGLQSSLSETTLQVLASLLEDDDPAVRQAAALSLGSQSSLSETVLRALTSLLEDDNPDVRQAAAESLGSQSSLSETVLQALTSLLEHDDSHVREMAILSLQIPLSLPKTTLQALASLVEDDDPYVRISAAEFLGTQFSLSETALQALASLLEEDDNPDLSEAVAHALNKSEMTLQAIALALKDNDERVRVLADEALGRPSSLSETTLRTLASLLEDDNPDVRQAAAKSLGTHSSLSETALQVLTSLLKDNDSRVRSSAARSLCQQSSLSEMTLQALASLLQDDDFAVRIRVASGLGTLPNLSEIILQALASLLNDDHHYARNAAANALGNQSTLPKGMIIELASSVLKDNPTRRDFKIMLEHREDFYSILPELNLECLKSLFTIWIEGSIVEQLSCCLRDGHLHIDTPGGLRKVLCTRRVMLAIQEVRKDIGIPFHQISNTSGRV